MDKQRADLLIAAGVDLEGVLERFMGNEGLFFKFLKKFPDDKSYHEMLECYGKENWEGAFRCAHTLKGIAGNLGLNPLYLQLSRITEEFRLLELTGMEEELREIGQEYDKLIKMIGRLT